MDLYNGHADNQILDRCCLPTTNSKGGSSAKKYPLVQCSTTNDRLVHSPWFQLRPCQMPEFAASEQAFVLFIKSFHKGKGKEISPPTFVHLYPTMEQILIEDSTKSFWDLGTSKIFCRDDQTLVNFEELRCRRRPSWSFQNLCFGRGNF